MPPSLQIDNTSITSWEDLDGNVKRSRLEFLRESEQTDPYLRVSMGNAATAIRLTNIAAPSAGDDATNKAYVDALINGLTIKAPVRVVAIGQGDLSTAFAAGQQVDGLTLVTGNRILLAGQTNAVENGIYIVQATGAPNRASDVPANGVFRASGMYVFIDEGTVYMDRSFVCTSDKGSDLVGVDALQWTQFGARPSAYRGFGLTMGTANALDVDASVIPVLANNQTFSGNNTFGGTVTVNASVFAPKVTNLQTASITQNSDAVNLEYLNTVLTNSVNGAEAKSAARVAAYADMDLSTIIAGSSVNGVLVAAGDRILLTGQINDIENGLYTISTGGDPPQRTSDMATGSHAFGAVVAVGRQSQPQQSRLFICVTMAGMDIVGEHSLWFLAVGHTILALAGTALTGNLTNLRLDVRTDDLTIETNPNNSLQLKDGGITSDKIATASIPNVKLVNPQVQVKVARGLQRTTTDGTSTTSPSTDTDAASDYGLTVNLGENVGLRPDFTVLPDLQNTNTFSANNTFTGVVSVTNNTVSTSRTTGALVVTGGVGVGGDLFCSNTYNMSDERLKDNIEFIPDALEAIDQMRGVTFTWNQNMPDLVGTSSVGVIAQEAQKVAPHVVTKGEDSEYLAVEYSKLVPYLIESVKTLKRKYEAIAQEVDTLRAAPPQPPAPAVESE